MNESLTQLSVCRIVIDSFIDTLLQTY